MAECHPVGFQWVMEAKERGAKVIHVDPRFTRTSALADLHVPIRAGSDIAFLGGIVNYILENERWFSEYVAAYTNAADDHRRGVRATPRTSTACSPAGTPRRRAYDLDDLAVRGQATVAAGGQREAGRPGEQAHGAHGGGRHRRAARGPTRRSSTRAASSSSCKRHFRRYTPELVEEVCGVPARALPRGRRGAVRRTPAASARPPSATRSAGRSTPSACSTSARPRSSSCCSATSAGPAAASWRCAATPRSRARPTSRRSTTSCPATSRCRTPQAHHDLADVPRSATRRGRAAGATLDAYIDQPAEGLVGRRRDGRTTTSASTTCRASPATTRPTRR